MTTPTAPLRKVGPRTAGVLSHAGAAGPAGHLPSAPPPSHTPRRLRQFQVIAVVAMLLLGVVGVVQVLDLRTQLSSAPNLADQYARLGGVETDLVEAGNIVAFAAVGSPNTDVTKRIDSASRALIVAAAERPADSDALAALNSATLTYGALLHQGVGSPQASTLLAQADKLLNSDIRPGLAALRTNLTTEAQTRSWAFSSWPVWLAATLVLGALCAISVPVARRSHRIINLGLVGAAAGALLIAVLGVAAISTASSADQSSRVTEFQKVTSLTSGSLALADLRGGQVRAAWTKTISTDSASRLGELTQQLATAKVPKGASGANVAAQHKPITQALTKSSWAAAITGLLAEQTANAETAFILDTRTATAAAVKAAASKPGSATGGLTALAVTILTLAVLGAGAAYLGLGVRLKEYR